MSALTATRLSSVPQIAPAGSPGQSAATVSNSDQAASDDRSRSRSASQSKVALVRSWNAAIPSACRENTSVCEARIRMVEHPGVDRPPQANAAAGGERRQALLKDIAGVVKIRLAAAGRTLMLGLVM